MSGYRKKNLRNKIMACMLLINFGTQALVGGFAFAKTVAVPDKAGGKNPGVSQAANGTTVVNIRTPNGKGLSHNQYLDLQIDRDGIIFNNSGNISKTQLAGYINGNPYMKGTQAKIVLNEVTGNLPTKLNGYMEIAGSKASLVLANPNGIVGSNFGFINVDRATVTTGMPHFDASGGLNGFTVERGDIEINGEGMDAKTVSQTDIIANAVKINAGLWANDLNIITGTNNVNYADNNVTQINNMDNGISLDVAAIGGMYAGQIKLIGTAKGVGVNNEGVISASEGITITQEGKIINNNTVSSKGTAVITANDDITNNSLIYAQGNAGIKTNSNFYNTDKMLSDASVDISAEKRLENTALINAVNTTLKAETLDNKPTGTIYGDNIAIEAVTLNNIADTENAPVIAARNNMELGIGTLNNKEHAIIMSRGDMSIGGSLDAQNKAAGSAQVINNNSATIEAEGNLKITSDEINNTNEHFKTEIQLVDTEHIIEYQGEGSAKRYTDDGRGGEIKFWDRNDPNRPPVYIYNDECDQLQTPEGNYDYWYKYDYTREIYKDVIIETDPGKIMAGQNMIITAGTVTNDKSNIVAGADLDVTADTVNNIESPGKMIYKDSGTAVYTYRVHHSGSDSTGHSTAPYAPADTVQDIVVQVTEYKADTTPPTSGSDANNYKEPVEITDLGNGIRITEVNTDIPTSSLYTVNQDLTADYLIETDPAFANYDNWISSNYFFEQMQYDPDTVAKRLGDGYYEQQLIKDQVLKLTGNRYLADYTNDEEQYKALMDNAVAFAKKSGAKIGVALTQEQIALLDTDIVWMVEKAVMLPDGRIVQALVPQVYVIAAEDAYVHGSAVISATDVNFNVTNDLLNKGTIQGDTAKISANNINNVNGIIQGSDVAINAVRNINNTGGSILSQNDLALFAGEDININSKLNTQYSSQGYTTNIGAAGTVKVTGESGTLNMRAGNDVNINAGIIDNAGGETNITAGNNINLGTAEISRSQDILWDSDNKRHDDMTAEVGSVITGKGSINFNAGNDINAKAATVSGEDAVNLNAQNNINIEAGRQEINLTDDHKHKGSSGGGHSQTVTIHNEIHENTAIGSSIYGDNVNINAGNEFNLSGSDIVAENEITINSGADTNIIGEENAYDKTHTYRKDKKGFLSSEKTNIYDYAEGEYTTGSTVSGGTVDINSGRNVNIAASNVVADNDVNINAEGKIDVGTMEDTYDSEYIYKVQKSGIFAGGGFGITIGSEKKRDEYANKNIENAGSTIGSIEGSVNLTAKDDANVTGSEVIAGKDINITGKNVNIESAENIYNAHEEHEYKRTGITVSIGGQAIDIAENAINHIERAGQVEDERLAALHAYKAYDTVTEVTQKKDNWSKLENAVKDPAKNLSLNVSFGTNKSESSSDSTTIVNQGSNIKAQGDVTITSTEEDINIKGSNVEGENVTLNAAKDLNVTASKDSNVTKESSESSSASIGVGLDIITGSVESINIGGSKAEGTVDANSTNYNESTVTANKELDFTSGKDTNIVGGKLSGEKVTGNVGGDLNIESLQDSNSYNEENKSAGLNIGISVVPGKDNPNKSGIYGSASESNIDSKYDSVTDQSGIYAGREGFDIYVENNTDLKGGIISGDNTDKNKLSTGTLTYEDIKNEAEYEAGSHGVAIDTSEDADRKDAGLTPNIGMPVEDEADSTTKATVSEGVIEIRDKENQKQDLADLNRDTQNALNKLGEIFDKNDVKEKQEFVGLAQELGHKMIGDLTGKISLEQKAMLNTFLEGLISQWANGDFSGAAGGAAAVEMAKQALWEIKDPAVRQWAAEILGAVVSKAVGGEASTGASSAVNTEKYNGLSHEEQEKIAFRLEYALTQEERYKIILDAYNQSEANRIANPQYGEAIEQYLMDELNKLQVYDTGIGVYFKVDPAQGLHNNLIAAESFFDYYNTFKHLPEFVSEGVVLIATPIAAPVKVVRGLIIVGNAAYEIKGNYDKYGISKEFFIDSSIDLTKAKVFGIVGKKVAEKTSSEGIAIITESGLITATNAELDKIDWSDYID